MPYIGFLGREVVGSVTWNLYARYNLRGAFGSLLVAMTVTTISNLLLLICRCGGRTIASITCFYSLGSPWKSNDQ